MKDIITALIVTALIWGAAYILGHEIRLGLREVQISNDTYKVNNGHFYPEKEEAEKAFNARVESEEGK